MFSLHVEETSAAYEERETIMIKVKINGQERSWDGDPDLPLLWFLRDEVGLTGTKFGCGQALCGSCTVIVDKQAVRACITSVSDVVNREVTTIEGLHPTGDHAVRRHGAR
jgi:isoquinoline 1-oxidoreductase alpha subunit